MVKASLDRDGYEPRGKLETMMRIHGKGAMTMLHMRGSTTAQVPLLVLVGDEHRWFPLVSGWFPYSFTSGLLFSCSARTPRPWSACFRVRLRVLRVSRCFRLLEKWLPQL